MSRLGLEVVEGDGADNWWVVVLRAEFDQYLDELMPMPSVTLLQG